MNQPDDKTLITEAITEAQKASREGRPGGVLDFLNLRDLKFNDMDIPGAGGDIANYIKNQKPDIQFAKIEPIVTGDDARIESPATVSVSILSFSKEVPIPNVIIKLKRETDREWLFIPKKKWKITEIRASIEGLPSIPTGN